MLRVPLKERLDERSRRWRTKDKADAEGALARGALREDGPPDALAAGARRLHRQPRHLAPKKGVKPTRDGVTLARCAAACRTLGYGTDTATIQTAAINSVNRRIEGMHRWPWQEATTGYGRTRSRPPARLTSLPADLLHIDTVRLENGTTYLDLEWERPVEIRRLLHLDRDNGTPTLWTKWNGQILVYPRADLAYTATLDYIKDPVDLVADGDTRRCRRRTTTS
jgi:hypothetical protein